MYTLAFWAKVDAKEGIKRDIVLTVRTPDDLNIFLDKIVTLDSIDWKQYTFSFVTPKDITGLMRVYFMVGQSDIDFWIDDVRFFEGEPKDEIKIEETSLNQLGKITASWGKIKALK